MSLIVVDVESDGQIPSDYSMVCFGAVIVDDELNKTFLGKTKPVSKKWLYNSLKISGYSRAQHLNFDDPKQVMEQFEKWIVENSIGRPVFISDNLAFDWQWINWYFHHFLGRNPFGYSGRRIGDLYSGMEKNMYASQEWKSLYRKTNHDHNPVNDAMGNAEALLEFKKLGLKI